MPPHYQEYCQRTLPTHQSKGCFTVRWRDDALCEAEPYQVGVCAQYCDWPKTASAPSLSPTLGSQLAPAPRPQPWWTCHDWIDSSRHKLGAVCMAFSDWILPPLRPWEVLLLTPRGATVSGSRCFPLLLLCNSTCLPLWSTYCGCYCICKCAPAPAFSFLPRSLLPSPAPGFFCIMNKEHYEKKNSG